MQWLDGKVTFWRIYRQALGIGAYDEWRDIVRAGLIQGMTEDQIRLANSLALLTNVLIPIVIVALILAALPYAMA